MLTFFKLSKTSIHTEDVLLTAIKYTLSVLTHIMQEHRQIVTIRNIIYTLKSLIGITPNSVLLFVSKFSGGRATDIYVTHQSRFLDKVIVGDVILGDGGFDIADDLDVYGAHLKMPSFIRG